MNKNICKHYLDFCSNKECKFNLNYHNQFGSALDFVNHSPCLNGGNDSLWCPYHEKYSKEEMNILLSASEKYFEPTIRLINQVKLIHSDDLKQHENCGGSIACPVCQGELYYSFVRALNYSFGRCSTDNCIFWLT